MKWWQKSVVYQIYTRSFQDTNDDGIGDIPGIISRLDYLADLGVDVIWLSPVYTSPNVDNGYDVSDYRDINKEYGTMEDMDNLIIKAEQRGIHIIMDLVINHTSNEHEWFQKSRDITSEYSDYYIWKPSNGKKLPNNWTSFFAQDCWTYDEVRGEYYLHLFAKEQPDLNYNNPKVIKEVKDMMRFWLDKGIKGFRCDVINILHKSSLENGKQKLILTGSEHYLTTDGTHKLLKDFRKEVFDEYDCFTVGETVFVTPEQGKKLCDSKRKELDMVFFFDHVEVDQFIVKWIKKKRNVKKLGAVISKWQRTLEWNANYLECHDQLRSVSRYGNESKYRVQSAKMLATLLLTLKGTPFIYQGQEIGMTNFDYTSMEQLEDVESKNVDALLMKYHIPKRIRWKIIKGGARDNARTPMQWTQKIHAGFTMGKPWLEVNSNYSYINVDDQLMDKASIMNYYKQLIQIRGQSLVLLKGWFRPIKINHQLFVYQRQFKSEIFEIALNFTGKTIAATLKGELVKCNYDLVKKDSLQPYEARISKL